MKTDLSQKVLHYVYKHPKLLQFLIGKRKNIEHKVVELAEFEYEPTLEDLEEMVNSKDFLNCMREMEDYVRDL